jgi:hypothetical protein
MFDELEILRDSADLQRLLDHYIEACAADRECWQDRRMEMEGVEPRDLIKLHGLLIAFGWLEQNVGHMPIIRAGAVPCCYRVTATGVRIAKIVRSGVPDEAEMLVASGEEEAIPKQRKPKAKKSATAVVEEPVGSVG